MIERLRKALMPPRATKRAEGPTGYRRLLGWAALPVTDRRWAAPLSAVALGFGLFVGVAIGPGAAGTFATGAAPIVELPGFAQDLGVGGDDEGGGGSSSSTATADVPAGGGSPIPAASEPLPIGPIASSEEGGEVGEAPGSSQEEPAPSEQPEPEDETFHGVVLHVNPAAGSYALAGPGGALNVVHSAKAPQPGARLSVPVRPLFNGTFAEAGPHAKTGKRGQVAVSGTVTYLDPTPAAPTYTLSSRGVSVLVHVHPDPEGAPPSLPGLGTFAKVAVQIEKVASLAATSEVPASEPVEPPAEPSPPSELPPPAPALQPSSPEPPVVTPPPPACAPAPGRPAPPAIQPSAVLWQRQVSPGETPSTHGDFAGIVEAICPEAGQLLLSADDVDESGHDLTFTVPATIDTSQLKAGESIVATATIAADGSLAMTGLASDERARGADDEGLAQGDLAPPAPSRRARLAPRVIQEERQLPRLRKQGAVGAP